ncbi:aspartic peptidase domain-containing protein, partial [Lasiosphaeria ovina]
MIHTVLAFFSVLPLLATAWLSPAAIRSIAKRGADQQQAQNVVRLPMKRRYQNRSTPVPSASSTSNTSASSATATATTRSTPTPTPGPHGMNLTAMFTDVAYGVELWIGTPAQLVTLDFDTGSSETWIDPPCSLMGIPAWVDLCRSQGTFVPDQSATVVDLNDTARPRWILYGTGAALVRFYEDIFTLADPYDVKNVGKIFKLEAPVQFGLALYTEGLISGILGAGYGIGYNQNYSGIIDSMYDQGLIQDKDFSIGLGSINETGGEIIFGGIDLGKFSGPLHGLHLARQVEGPEGYYRYWINVSSIAITPPGSCLSVPLTDPESLPRPFMPDTGTTLTYLPETVFNNLLQYFPSAQATNLGYTLDCSHADDLGSIDFSFDELTIHIPFRDFIVRVPSVFTERGNETYCVIGAMPAFGDILVLGDTFLRAAYAVFRQQEHMIYLAQHHDCGTNIVSSHGKIDGLYGDCGPKPEVRARYEDPLVLPSSAPSPTPLSTTCASYSTATYSPVPTFASSLTSWANTTTTQPRTTNTTSPQLQTANATSTLQTANATSTLQTNNTTSTLLWTTNAISTQLETTES